MNNIEIKEKIVRQGESRVFQNWHDHAGIEMEDFIEGLRWLCEDPLTKDGKLTRELGVIRHADSGMTEEEKAMWNPTPHRPGVDRLYRLTRHYDKTGMFTFYDEEGHAWGGSSDYASISAKDRI